MTIKINKKKYTVKYTIRALFIFEQITNKPFEQKSLLDTYVFFYSMILANNKDKVLEWDEFIDALDNDPSIILQMQNLVNEKNKIDEVLYNADEDNGEEKKS